MKNIILLFIIACFQISIQAQELFNSKHVFTFNISLGMVGGAPNINLHVPTTSTFYTSYGTSLTSPDNASYTGGGVFSFHAVEIGYTFYRRISFDLNLWTRQSEKLDVEGMKGCESMHLYSLKTRYSFFRTIDLDQDIGFYIGYGCAPAIHKFKYEISSNNVGEIVYYKPKLGQIFTFGCNISYIFFEFNYYNLGKLQIKGIAKYEDWKTYNGNRLDILFGLRIPLSHSKSKINEI